VHGERSKKLSEARQWRRGAEMIHSLKTGKMCPSNTSRRPPAGAKRKGLGEVLQL